jgi:enediyne biosynthesis protein E11
MKGMNMPENEVLTDLIADADEVDRILADLDEAQWRRPTPARGWTVAHQVAHLAATFQLAALAASDPSRFKAVTSQLSDDFDANVTAALAPYLDNPPDVLLEHWHTERARAVQALSALPPDEMVPWLVRPLPAAVLAGAGMMELFAHGQDIVDALRVQRRPTDRLRHLVAFAVRTWDFGYLARGLTPPATEFRYELIAPSGAVWHHGPADADQRITGPAFDFCLLVTRRRHRADLSLEATGADADRWLDIAQAYRGSPGTGRSPGELPSLPR